MRVLTVENIRKVEEKAHNYGISYLQMMENAGSYCARVIRKTFNGTNKKNVLVVCGKGKNGGDGFVIARKLCEDGYDVTVMMAMGLPSDSESSEMLSRVRAMGIDVVYFDSKSENNSYFNNAQIIVDCVFGIGFYGDIDYNCSSLFKRMNNSDGTVVSIDVPSGLSGNLGKVSSNAVNAQMTIAIMALKPVHILKPSCDNCGTVVPVPIGIPETCFEEVADSFFTMNKKEIRNLMPVRDPNGNKGTFGTVLIIGGSYEMPNAVYFASQAAVNSGAGLVKLAFPVTAYNALAPKTYEQVLIPLESNKYGRISQNAVKRLQSELSKCSVVAVGCGMGVDEDTKSVLKYVLENSPVPVIIDADGINCLENSIELIDSAKAPIILTPHPKEMSRIAGTTVESIEGDRGAAVSSFIKTHRATLVLKGSSTLVGSSDSDNVYVNCTGNAGMATGGSGDVLTGIVASFIAQGMNPFEAAISAVNIHGLSGDAVTEKYSMMGNTPSEMLKSLPFVLKNFE